MLRALAKRARSAYVVSVTLNGSAIRALREAREMSLRELARQTGRCRGHLSRIERGIAGGSTETGGRIATSLEVPIAAITNKEST